MTSPAYSAPGYSVLVVDDQPAQTRPLCAALRARTWRVTEVASLEAARQALAGEVFSLVVLDRELHVGAGKQDGMDLCREIRSLGIPSRVVFYTNLVSPAEHRAGWTAGADDYIEKAWSIDVAMARCEAHLTRGPQPSSVGGVGVKRFIHPQLSPGQHLIVDENTLTVARAEDLGIVRQGGLNKLSLSADDRERYKRVKMTDLDLAVFFHLYARPDEWVSEQTLLRDVWAYSELRISRMMEDPDANSGLVQTTLARIRRKVDTRLDPPEAKHSFDNRRPWAYVETSSASEQTFVGYRFNAASSRLAVGAAAQAG